MKLIDSTIFLRKSPVKQKKESDLTHSGVSKLSDFQQKKFYSFAPSTNKKNSFDPPLQHSKEDDDYSFIQQKIQNLT